MDMLLNFIYAVNQREKQYIPVKETTQSLSDYFGDRTLKGRVTDISGENAIISFPGKNIAVQMLTPLESGQMITVRLKGSSPEQLTLQILSEKGENKFVLLLNRNPETILKDLNMKQNQENTVLIKEAMTYGLPLEKDFLEKSLKIFKDGGGEISGDMDIIAFMKMNKLPVVKEIFDMLKNFKENPLPLTERLETLSKNLAQLKSDENPEIKKSAENLIKLLDNLYLKTDLSKEELASSLKNIVKNIYTPTEKHISYLVKNMEMTGNQIRGESVKNNLMQPMILNDSVLNMEELKKNLVLKLRDLLNNLETEDLENVIKEKTGSNIKLDDLIKYFKEDGEKNISLKDFIKDKNLPDLKDIKPEVLEKILSNKIDLKELIKNIDPEGKKLQTVIDTNRAIQIKQSGQEDKSNLSKTIASTLNHIDTLYVTMKNKSSSFGELPYLLLPLPLNVQGQLKRGEMRIYKRNPEGNKPMALKEIRLDILLETLNLGPVEITIQSKNNKSDCKITVTKGDIKDVFESNLSSLRELLENNKFKIGSLTCNLGEVDFSPLPLVPAVEKETPLKTIDARI